MSHNPSTTALFSLLSPKSVFLYAIPAVLASLLSGAIAPYMTIVVGRSFDAFARFPLSQPTPDDKSRLLHAVGIAALELLSLGAAALTLSSITSALWVATGEHNTRALRLRVYDAVTAKSLAWFDEKAAAEPSTDSATDDSAPLGPGGLMSTFSQQTEQVRLASSLASGLLLQYVTTCLTCLILAFLRSWSLTLVVLSAIPALILIQGFSQAVATPLLTKERSQLASAASLLDRTVRAIATVKAHNAAPFEQRVFASSLDRLCATVLRLSALWGTSAGLAQFATMAMFVQGFWFGARLVRNQTLSPGDVMAVFWACLIATSSLQMCIPQLIVLAKGRSAIACLLTLIDSPSSTTPPATIVRKIVPIRKIAPKKCLGELALHNITFAYPARPNTPALADVSLFLPARETTFIVGGSGSGKSSVARLLLALYAPQRGLVHLDNQDVAFLDPAWVRAHVACISNSECVLVEGSVHDNVAMGVAGAGRDPATVTREEVVDACRAALMHEFVRDLPQGYDTLIGHGGACLSGGQKQRLAIARAKLRNPIVLILDEATSALDATSRVLVFEALKRWRAGKTTVVITHDISQIEPQDFVYVLRAGSVVEQGYRYDLEAAVDGAFGDLLRAQSAGADTKHAPKTEKVVEKKSSLALSGRSSRPVSWGNWFFDGIPDFTLTSSDRLSRLLPPTFPQQSMVHAIPPQHPSPAYTMATRPRFNSPLRSSSPGLPLSTVSPSGRWVQDDPEFDAEKSALQRSGSEASRRRPLPDTRQRVPLTVITEDPLPSVTPTRLASRSSFWGFVRDVYPTVPCKALVALGLGACVLNGAMTPVFSLLLSRLIFEVSIGAQATSAINAFGGIVLGVAALDGVFLGVKHFMMETAAMRWVTHMRKTAYARVLAQDKKWFDRTENGAARLVQVVVRDGDEAGNLVGVVLGQCVVVAAMLSVGLVWALAKGWQLTMVGLAIAPVFAGAMAFQTGLVARCELRTKRATEEVAMSYYETLSNIRGIRCMALESIFRRQFEHAAEGALAMGMRGAFVEGSTHGVASALIYVAEAMLFYVGAVLIAKGTYTYLQMVEVLNLVVFTVTIGSQLLSCTQKIAKSVQATRDFNTLLKLSADTDESWGILPPPPTGEVSFDKVSFAYPERPDALVLKDLSMHVADGECVAIVGSSGSGKSTIAALLQRLYEPDTGSILIGSTDLRATDVHQLREQVAIVSQHPHLFDATVAENIAYGCQDVSVADVVKAAQAANVDEFIRELPQGYDTLIGEDAVLLSSGQAQRLQIARALVRPGRVLILDECTSALDAENQAAVMETVRHAKVGRTTIMVTHKLPVMRMCDRIVVVCEGRVAEEGTYEELMWRKGVFRTLANAGEWQGE